MHNIQLRLNRINKMVSKAVKDDIKTFLTIIDTDKTRYFIIKHDGTRQEVKNFDKYNLKVSKNDIHVNIID